jgi:hypothetical protein
MTNGQFSEEDDERFFLSKLSAQELAVYEALQGRGNRRSPYDDPKADNIDGITKQRFDLPFTVRRAGERVELTRWSWNPDWDTVIDLYNEQRLTWRELWERGYRWGVLGDITIVQTTEEYRRLVEVNPYTFDGVNLIRGENP